MFIRLTLALGVFCLAGAVNAADDDAPYVKLNTLIPPGDHSALCLARAYDEAHLKQHPKQKVTELVLAVRYVPLSEDNVILQSRDDGGTDKIYFRYDFTLAARTRDQEHRLFAYGDCSSAQGIGCGVDCDGGGFELEPVAGTKNALLFRLGLEHGGKYIRMTIGCDGGPHEVNLTAGEDDKVFRLDKAPASVCETMQAEYDKLVQ